MGVGASFGMGDHLEEAPIPEMRVADDLISTAHRARPDAGLLENAHCFTGLMLGGPSLNTPVHLPLVLLTSCGGGKPFFSCPRGIIERAAEGSSFAVIADSDGYPGVIAAAAVAALEHGGGVAIPPALW